MGTKPLITTGWPQRIQVFLAGLLGLPIETRKRKIDHPFLIVTSITLMAAIHFIASLNNLALFVEEWGFIPRFVYRKYFLTIFTSFFIHASWMHLLGNVYYFYVFGDDVEDDTNLIGFFKLIFGGHIFGLLLHTLLSGQYYIPLVGASAGISALLGYYLVRFPKRQITYMLFFFYIWIHLPAFAALMWKFGWEILIASATLGQRTGVAHWAHIGGTLWGIWMGFKSLPDKK